MIVGIADALKLYLFPSLQRLLNQYLRCEGEGRLCNFLECLFIRTHAGAQSAQSVCRTYHDRITYAARSGKGIIHILTGLRYRHLQVDLVKFLHEEVTILCVHDSLNACTEHTYTILLQHTGLIKLCATVQCGLSAKGKQDAVRALLLYHLCNEMRIYRQEIDLIGYALTCLDCCYVWIDEH